MKKERIEERDLFCVVKAVLLALAISLFAVVVFAVILKVAPLRASTVYAVNQILKGCALAVGILVCVRGEKGWMKGGIIGVVFTMVSYLAFSAIGGDFSLSWLIFLELAFAFVIGAIGGIVAVNLKN